MDFRIQRHLMGVVGLLLFTIAVLLRLNASQAGGDFLASSLLRVGILLCLLWMALPGLESLYKAFPKWAWVTALLILLVGAVQRNLLIVFGAILLALAFLQFVKYFLPSVKESKPGKTVDGRIVKKS